MTITEYLEIISPKYSGYQELHVHTEGSYRDAANTVKDVFDAAEELGRNAVAITDHGNWTRLFEALKERTKREKKHLEKELQNYKISVDEINKVLKTMGPFDSVRCPNDKMKPYIEKYTDAFIKTAKNTVQFIPGVEMYEGEPVEGDEHRYHIVLYPKDWEGAKVLFTLCNLAQLNKHNDMPRCTMETLRFFIGEGSRGHGHIIGTSACMQGHLASILLKPYNISQKQNELREKQENMTIIPKEALDEALSAIENAENELPKLREEVNEAKKLVKKNYETGIQRAEKALQKAISKNPSEDQLLLGGMTAAPNEDIILAQEKLDNLIAEQKKAKAYEAKLPEMINNLEQLKKKIAALKESYKGLKQQNAPAERIQEKIDALAEQALEIGDVYAEAKNIALQYKSIFGEDDFYIELQDHGIMEEYIIRNQLIQIARETNIPLTVANDVHYKNPTLQRKRDIIAATRFPDTTVDDVANRRGNDQLWFKPNEMMMALFSDVTEAIENTCRIAEKCNVYYQKGMHLPEFKDEKYNLSPAEYLKKISYDNILARYPDCKEWPKEKRVSFKKRLDYELSIIEKMGYSSYISIVEDFISFAKRNFSPEAVGPGRGSGAGSVVCYLTGITNIDPLKYNLIFERFLNPERVSMPDIDTDFAPSIRDKVVDYVAEKYSYKEPYWVPELSGTVCNIVTEGTLAARKSIRQVGKVTGVPLNVCDKVAKLVPNTVGISLKKALEESEDLKNLYDSDEQVKKLIQDSMLVEGVPDQTGVHAAGVIIADKPISEYAPMFFNDKKNCWVIQYDMVSCESDIGLLKMDFLGLRNLDIIMRTKSFIKKTKGSVIDFRKVNNADDNTVIDAIYANGDTDGVFQFESGGMKKTLQSFMPANIDDVILLNAAYRPGPMQFIPEVTEVKFGRTTATYIVPEMESIMGNTYGSPIYQEQIQQIFHEIAGFSLGQADIIRRAMSKKHLDELEAAKDNFVEGFKKKGAHDEAIETLWSQLLAFASYAFNKCATRS